MKDTINTYVAMLIITIFASAATMLIVHVVYDNAFIILVEDPENYTMLSS